MNLKEIDQFITDPIIHPDEKILVPQGWLQLQLRELYELRRTSKRAADDLRTTLDTNARLRADMMVLESKQPYTILNVKA